MKAKKSMVPFFAVMAAFQLAASFAHPVTPTIFTNLNLGSYMFGVALAAMMTVNFLFSPFWGKINTYISSRNSMMISSIGYALGQVMFGLAQTEAQVIGARMFAGLFTGGAFVSMLTYIVNFSEDEKIRGKYLTLYATIQSVCGAFGYFVGGFLGVESPYVAVTAQVIVLAACGIGFRIFCDDDTKISIKLMDRKAFIKEANPFKAFADSKLFMTSLLAVLFGMCVLQNLGMNAFDQTFNYYIKDIFDFPSTYNGALKGIMGLITLIANSTICMWLINRTNVNKSIIGVFVLCSSTMLIAVLFDSVVPFVASNVIFYAFNGISIPLLQNMVANKSKEGNSNLIMGFYNAMKSLGGIVGALLSGFLYTFNPKFPFIFGFAAFLIALVGSVYYYRHDREKA